MKILLVNPPLSLEERYGSKMKKFGAISEPMGLAYIASFLEKKQYNVKILDAAVLGMSLKDMEQFLKDDCFDIIGITMLTTAYSAALNTLRIVKKVSPHTVAVCGGPHPTALPKETLEEIRDLDIICIGEGEYTMYEIVKTLENNGDFTKIKGIAFRQDDKIVINAPRPYEKELDSFPIPARHLLPVNKYSLTTSRTSGGRYCPTVIVARGCPFKCAFCFRIFGSTFRHHSIERIIEELKLLVDKYQASQVNLEADTISLNKRFLISLCDAIISNKINKKIKWTCESRIDTIDEDILKKMKEAGCWQISYGVESGVQRLLDIIQKGIRLEQVERIFKLTKKHRISIRSFFMLGLPTETREESHQTIEFAKKLDADWAQFTLTVPYPGTHLYSLVKNSGDLKSKNWDEYNTWGGWKEERLPYVTGGRTEEELRELQKIAFYRYCMRPKIFFRFLRKSLSSFPEFRKILSGFLTLLTIKEKRQRL